MGIITISCDYPECGKVMPVSESYNFCGEGYFCRKHSVSMEIAELERSAKNKLDWLKNTHLADVKKLRARRRELQKELAAME